MRPPFLLPALLALAACGRVEPVAGPDPRVEVRVPTTPSAPGAEFPLTLVRAWRTGEAPSEALDRDLAPLSVRRTAATRRDDGTRVEERIDYAAHAFSLSDVVLRPVPLTVRGPDGAERRAASSPARVVVRPTLPEGAPGAPELPDPVPRGGVPWAAFAAVAGVVGAAAVLARRARRRAATPPVIAAPSAAAAADARALGTLASLAAAPPADAIPAAAEALRAWLRDRLDVPAPRRTTEETLSPAGGLGALGAAPAAQAARVLRAADAVKFARQDPDAAGRDEVLAAAAAVVRGAAEGAR